MGKPLNTNNDESFIEEIREEDEAIQADQQRQIDDLLGVAVEPTPEEELEDVGEPEASGEDEEEGEGADEQEPESEDDPFEGGAEGEEGAEPVSQDEGEEGEDEEDDESPEALKQQIAAMRQRLEEYATGTETKLEPAPEKTQEGDKKQEVPAAKEGETLEPQEFVTPQEFQAALRSPQELNKLLNKVHSAGVQSVMRTMPQLIGQTVSRQMSLMQARDRFYQQNPDLEQHKRYVAFVTNRVIAANPELGIEEALEKVAEQVRQDLALSVKAQETNNARTRTRKSKPAFAGKKGGTSRRAAVEQDLSEQQKQMNELLDLDI